MKKIIAFLCMILLATPVFAAENIVSAGVYVTPMSLIKKYKEISWRTHNTMKSQVKNMSEQDKSVIQKYVYGAVRGEDTFLLINCNLNGTLQHYIPKKEITKPLKYRLDYYSEQLSKPIFKTRLPQNTILYKEVDPKGITYIFADKKLNDISSKPVTNENLTILKQRLKGATYTEKGFMLTYYDINAVKEPKFVLEVNSPKNLQAVLLEEINTKSDKEVLINRNTKWEVSDISIKTDKKSKKDFYLIKIKFIKK